MENQNELENSNQTDGVATDNRLYADTAEVQPEAAMQPVVENIDPIPPVLTQPQIKYAGFWIRFAASFVDGLVLLIPQMIVSGIMTVTNFGAMQKVAANVASLLVTWAYYVFMTNKYQATLGKKAVGIRVFSTKPENLTLGQVILRETIGKFISMIIFFIGYVMTGFTQKKQALHDMLASTAVVYDDPNKKTPIWVFVVAALLPIVAIGGILASIMLVSLGSARGKAQDAGIKATLASVNVSALIYKEDNASYKGYVPGPNTSVIACSGQPVINISADGKQMAVFMKSCQEPDKYFCGNPETSLITGTAEVSEGYVKSGATICNFSDIAPALP
jgi:uncharacterized RDD family membrane protein YckC